MKTKFFYLTALVSVALAGCTANEYLGDDPGTLQTSQGTPGAIAFGSNAGKFTRATSNTGTVAEMLDGQFKVLGVKETSTPGTYSTVFPNYVVFNSTIKTNSNPDGNDTDADNTQRMNGWEYVGTSASTTYGEAATALPSDQTIKYWDWASDKYHFVAGSPVANFTFNGASDGITTASVTGLKGHITANAGAIGTTVYNPVYIADPVNVPKANYNQEVAFSFKRQQTFVRVGVYEIIPGYRISEIHFYEYDTETPGWKVSAENNQNIILASTTANYFQGADDATATLTYNWTTPTYTFAYASGLTLSNNWYGGALSGVPATTSTHATVSEFYGTDKDMAATGYFTVIPSASALTAQPILIKCNYTLTSTDGSGETITVTGATAAIPAAFSKWNPNTTYTYLFKISDNTNGKTDPSQPNEGLYPITFDAAVIAEEDAAKLGFITTVSTPSITTYQEGSVVATGVEYVKDAAIYFTAQNDETGALNTLAALNEDAAAVGMVKVYKLAGAATEADLILTRPSTAFTTSVGAAAKTINEQEIAAAKWASFTPDAAGYYAIEYLTGFDSGTVIDTETSAVGYYKRTGDVGSYTYTKVTSGNGDGSSTYCKAAFAYKVVYVVAAHS